MRVVAGSARRRAGVTGFGPVFALRNGRKILHGGHGSAIAGGLVLRAVSARVGFPAGIVIPDDDIAGALPCLTPPGIVGRSGVLLAVAADGL